MTPEPTTAAETAPTLRSRLEAEASAHAEPAVRALLLFEAGAIAESEGDAKEAARLFQAAYNAAPERPLREALEALARLLDRPGSERAAGKVVSQLASCAASAEQGARARLAGVELALAASEPRLDEARSLLEETLAADPEDLTAWLELEVVAGALGDSDTRLRALAVRADHATDPEWRALLCLDLAERVAPTDPARALEALLAVAEVAGRARFRLWQAVERLAGGDRELSLRALDAQASLVQAALASSHTPDVAGVPLHARTQAFLADLSLRGGEVCRAKGDIEGWAERTRRAWEALPSSALVARAHIAALEFTASPELGQALREELEGPSGRTDDGHQADRLGDQPTAVSLWLRRADVAMQAGDRDGVRSALHSALRVAPASGPARAYLFDFLEDRSEPRALVEAHRALARVVSTSDAKSRAILAAAYVAAFDAEDGALAREALSELEQRGVSPRTLARVARSLATWLNDQAWYGTATEALVAPGPDEAPTFERAELWIELGWRRAKGGDAAGARAAFDQLAELSGHAWLGRALSTYGVALLEARGQSGVRSGDEVEVNLDDSGEPSQASRAKALARASALSALAEVESSDEGAGDTDGRGLVAIAALHAARGGDTSKARELLRALLSAGTGDETVVAFAAGLARAMNSTADAVDILSTCAASHPDAEARAVLHLEAGLLAFGAGSRARAVVEIEAAYAVAPEAAGPLLAWMLSAGGTSAGPTLGSGRDALADRRRVLELRARPEADPTLPALQRFGLESLAEGGDAAEALASLETVEREGSGDLALAAALARLAWPPAEADAPAAEAALVQLSGIGPAASSLAGAERFHRLARTGASAYELLDAARAWTEAAPSSTSALEWLGASLAADDRAAEAAARKLLASCATGTDAEALEASAEVIELLEPSFLGPAFAVRPPLEGEGWAVELLNLDLAHAGCDPRRRATTLKQLDSLGVDVELDALALAGWAELAGGQAARAVESFAAVTEARADDLAAWEGLRTAAEAAGEHVKRAMAAARLGELATSDERGSAFWEEAGLVLLERTNAHDDAEVAFERALERDPTRAVAFDKLFRRVRSRNDDAKLLQLIAHRLDVAQDEVEMAKLFWERARVLRKQGDLDAALASLEDVRMLEQDHVGAIALAGEIHIIRKEFDKAAPMLAHLAGLAEAPTQQRLVSGVAAADLYEKQLGEPAASMRVLSLLHSAGLSTPPVRERLVRTAVKLGSFELAVELLDGLMREREKPEGRLEAAQLALRIWRDELQQPARALAAAEKILADVPDQADALELVLSADIPAATRGRLVARAKLALAQKLAAQPADGVSVLSLSRVAQAEGDVAMRHATLGALVALGQGGGEALRDLERFELSGSSRPQTVLDATGRASLADPADRGAIADLFAVVAEAVALALGPSLASLQVTKKERIDPRGGNPLRLAVAEWVGALGLETDFELYVGGPHPRDVTGVPGEVPALVVGGAVTAPLDAAARAAVAREVFALRRGTSVLRHRDDATIACIVVAACQEAGVAMANPPFALFSEVQRGLRKELSRKAKKALAEVAPRVAAERPDARTWAAAARRSLDRVAVVAAGDASVVAASITGIVRERLPERVDQERVRDLLGFVLSPSYLELRRKLGMGVR
jgi:tetratricopeptide (TPR) repeat protein